MFHQIPDTIGANLGGLTPLVFLTVQRTSQQRWMSKQINLTPLTGCLIIILLTLLLLLNILILSVSFVATLDIPVANVLLKKPHARSVVKLDTLLRSAGQKIKKH